MINLSSMRLRFNPRDRQPGNHPCQEVYYTRESNYMSADTLIESLSAIHPKGFDLSLDRIKGLLAKLGNPHEKLPPVIHVAGTNGKGSTIAFCRALLEASGYRVHVHTSPHLVNWHERYRLAGKDGGKLVSDPVLEDAIQRVADANAGKPITVFEILSAVMFILFSEHDADFCLVEVGLGGRFDATNVIAKSVVTAITPVSLDHQSYLGDTISQIAREKAGIIKHGVPVVVGPQTDEARETIESIAEKQNASVMFAGQDFDFYRSETGFIYHDESQLFDLPLPVLGGEHQLSNAAIALAVLSYLDIEVSNEIASKAMKTVYWPARMEKLPNGKIHERLGHHKDIWIDGGHNPSAGEAIANELIAMRAKRKVSVLLVCGMINTKDPSGFFKPFSALDAEVICVPVTMSEAGINPDDLAKTAISSGLRSTCSDSLETAIDVVARRLEAEPDTRVFFCGSLYLAGEVLALNDTPPV